MGSECGVLDLVDACMGLEGGGMGDVVGLCGREGHFIWDIGLEGALSVGRIDTSAAGSFVANVFGNVFWAKQDAGWVDREALGVAQPI